MDRRQHTDATRFPRPADRLRRSATRPWRLGVLALTMAASAGCVPGGDSDGVSGSESGSENGGDRVGVEENVESVAPAEVDVAATCDILRDLRDHTAAVEERIDAIAEPFESGAEIDDAAYDEISDRMGDEFEASLPRTVELLRSASRTAPPVADDAMTTLAENTEILLTQVVEVFREADTIEDLISFQESEGDEFDELVRESDRASDELDEFSSEACGFEIDELT